MNMKKSKIIILMIRNKKEKECSFDHEKATNIFILFFLKIDKQQELKGKKKKRKERRKGKQV